MVKKTQTKAKAIQWMILTILGLSIQIYLGLPLDPLFVAIAALIYLGIGVAFWWAIRLLQSGLQGIVLGAMIILVGLFFGIPYFTQLIPDMAGIGGGYILTAVGLFTEFIFAGWGR